MRRPLNGYLDKETADALIVKYDEWKAAQAGPKPPNRPPDIDAIALRMFIVQAEKLLRAYRRPSRIKRIVNHFQLRGPSYVKKAIARTKGL